ncbi:MAG: histidine kinase [Tannerella sp.]|jgi:sensor histidine kinase YesM|nr:histidine kinase [Tannerella sp.]
MNRKNNNWFELLLTSPRLRIVRHLLLQALLLALSLNELNNRDEEFILTGEYLFSWLSFYVILNILCYLNIYLFAPRLLLAGKINKYGWFILLLTLFLIVFSILTQVGDSSNDSMSTISTFADIIASLLAMMLVILSTSTMLLFMQWMHEQIRAGELKIATKQSELSLLKQQINPHFLFNMLNNANVLLKREPKEASQVLFKLEELLNYQLNNSTKEYVTLDSDINFLNDFLNLEKIRRDHFEYSITKKGDTSGIKLPPLLFIPFVENAVKHNSDSDNKSYIHITFKIANNELHFRCENSKPAVAPVKSKAGGLGLKNIQRRLTLLYPDKHLLEINNEDTKYTVILRITISN